MPGLRVGCGLFNLHEHPIAIWYIEHNRFSSKSDEVRRLRICISKIHVYKETLRLLLELMERGQLDNVKANLLRNAFDHLLSIVKKDRYYGFHNQDFWGLAYSIDEELHRGQWIGLVDRVKREVKALDNAKNITNNGIIVVDSEKTVIDHVFIGKRENELDDAIYEFSKEAECFLKKLEANGTEITELKKQIEVFCENVQENKPKKSVCNALLSGIKATLANASSAEALFNLSTKIMELL